MAAKKKPTKKSKSKSKKTSTKAKSFAAAAMAGDADAVFMAISTVATPGEAKNAVIFGCIVTTFHAQGFPQINNPQVKIVWATIPDPIIIALGNGIMGCINSKGFQCPPLAPIFATLKQLNRVTTVADLVTGIAVLVKP